MGRLSRFAAKVAKKAATKAQKAAASKPDLRVKPKAPSPLAVKPKAAPRALPAPPKPLALPAPGPGLPDFAAKPRGGQWWAEGSPYGVMNPAASSKENVYLGARFSPDPTDKALADWWDKALPRYIQNDFATPDDPFRALADQGYLQGIENAAQWSNRVKNDIVPMPLQKLLFDPKTAETGVRDEALAAMPWINKMPATENIYGFWPREGTIGALSHIRDEMVNALKPDISGIPADLAVRPESLGRMSFAQAAERVGLINQWRAKQAEQAALSAMDSPAIHTFKEYAENNPMGLRWVELKAPDESSVDTTGWSVQPRNVMGFQEAHIIDPSGRKVEIFDAEPGDDGLSKAEQAMRDRIRRSSLQDALKYEGDTMGHCVGGYCDDVLGGRSRIFSLRDAKGEPHVTIETAPKEFYDLADQDPELGDLFNEYHYGTDVPDTDLHFEDWVAKNYPETFARLPQQDIIQIKGKQNRAPKDDYLPFVQDFVKSGQWGNVGDLGNTGLVRLPDGRYITAQQAEEGIAAIPDRVGSAVYDPSYLHAMDPDIWSQVAPYFEGFAIGGRVDADRCFCRHPLSAKRKK